MTQWHHSPVHVFQPHTSYIITASTVRKEHFFNSPQKLALVQTRLFEAMAKYKWTIRAWAIMANHYHFIAQSSSEETSLPEMIKWFHSQVAGEINAADKTPGRQIWFQYWDTCLTYEKSYYARLNYVNNNPVHHKLVPIASAYPYCSMSWFEMADPSFAKKIASFKYDTIRIRDDF
jgi:putative transposase